MSWRCWWTSQRNNWSPGQVGTVVEVLAPDVYEVEFLDSKGGAIAVTELNRSELLLLQHEPVLAT